MKSSTATPQMKHSLTLSAVGLVVRTGRYLNEKFPPTQVLALAMGSVVIYLACGRLTTGKPELNWGAAEAAVTVTLFFLQVRLLDDFDTHYTGLREITHVTPRGLLVGVALTTVPIVVLNAGPSIIGYAFLPTAVMISASVAIALWCPLRTAKPLTSYRPHIVALVLGRIPLFDGGPVLAFFYVGAKWEEATGASVSQASIWLAVGVMWVMYEIWKVSRSIGRYEGYDYIYRPYGISWAQQRVLVAVLSLCGTVLSITLFFRAKLSIAFLVYACILGLGLVWLALKDIHGQGRPWWRGLVFPALMVAGSLVQFLALV